MCPKIRLCKFFLTSLKSVLKYWHVFVNIMHWEMFWIPSKKCTISWCKVKWSGNKNKCVFRYVRLWYQTSTKVEQCQKCALWCIGICGKDWIFEGNTLNDSREIQWTPWEKYRVLAAQCKARGSRIEGEHTPSIPCDRL